MTSFLLAVELAVESADRDDDQYKFHHLGLSLVGPILLFVQQGPVQPILVTRDKI